MPELEDQHQDTTSAHRPTHRRGTTPPPYLPPPYVIAAGGSSSSTQTPAVDKAEQDEDASVRIRKSATGSAVTSDIARQSPPLNALTSSRRPISKAARPDSITSLDAMLLSPFLSSPPSPVLDTSLSDSDMWQHTNRYSSADSFEFGVLATPGTPGPPRRASTTSITVVQDASGYASMDMAMAPMISCSQTTSISTPDKGKGKALPTVCTPPPSRPRPTPLIGISPRGSSLYRELSAPPTPSPSPAAATSATLSISEADSSQTFQPAIRVTETIQGAPRLSFVDSGSSLLEPPPNGMTSVEPTSLPLADSTRTVIDSPSPSPSTSPAKSVGSTPSKSTPVSRRRRLHALRKLVPNLDFAQPWDVIEHLEGQSPASSRFIAFPEHLVPDLDRLSFGHTSSNNASTLSLPQTSPTSDGSPLKTRRFSRSMASLVDSTPVNMAYVKSPVPQSHLAPFEQHNHYTKTSHRSPSAALPRRAATTVRKSASARSIGSTREVPRPRPRKESFGVTYSGFSKAMRTAAQRPQDRPSSWRASLSSQAVYDKLAKLPDGDLAIKRQEIIWEMSETELAFVRSCSEVIRLFASPLRDANGKWMQGLPEGVCELFDALQEILDAHTKVSEAQQRLRLESEIVDVHAFIGQLRDWVPCLACHEQYIMLFNAVAAQVDEAVRDPTSIFGEFLRLQTRDNALGHMSLGSMLLKPVQRLTKYTLFLRRLLGATPDNHPAHSSLLELIDATECTIGSLEACKAREDDFIQLKTLERTLDGLPDNFTLAIRGRRLVAHAQVIRVARDPTVMQQERSGSMRSLRATLSSTVASVRQPHHSVAATSQASSSRATSRSNTEIDLPLPPPVRGLSISSTATPSLHSMSSTAPSPTDRSLRRSPSFASLADSARQAKTARKARRDDLLTLLIFNDLVLLTTPVPERHGLFRSRKVDATRLRVLPASEGGVGTVEDIHELSGWGGELSAKHLTSAGYSRAFVLATRSPDGNPAFMSYALAPVPKSHVSALPGSGLETIEHVVGTIAIARRTDAQK